MNNTTCIRVVIRGRVQGVGYRAWTAGKAQKMQLAGWVRNCADGTVEAAFCGPEHEVRTMVEHCRKGPLLAKVTEVMEAGEALAAEIAEGFKILPSA